MRWLLLLLALGCSSPKQAPAAPASPKVAAPAKATEKPLAEKPLAKKPSAKKPSAKKPSAKKPSAKKAMGWPANIEWKTWEEGRALSAETGKPICLVVFANWCKRCKELAPAFGEPKIAELAGKMIMVRANEDDRDPWLEDYRHLGSYVPRVFFFDTAGELREDVKSRHPRYPYFYTPKDLGALEAAMKRTTGS